MRAGQDKGCLTAINPVHKWQSSGFVLLLGLGHISTKRKVPSGLLSLHSDVYNTNTSQASIGGSGPQHVAIPRLFLLLHIICRSSTICARSESPRTRGRGFIMRFLCFHGKGTSSQVRLFSRTISKILDSLIREAPGNANWYETILQVQMTVLTGDRKDPPRPR